MRALVVVSLFVGMAMAQDAPRRNTAGRVEDHNGRPVAGARVTLVHRTLGWSREVGSGDVVEVTTDSSGQFRTGLLVGRPYSAYATWRTDDQPIVSMSHEHIVCGAFTIIAPTAAIVDLRLQLRGQEAWANHGPLRFRVQQHTANMHAVDVAVDSEGLLRIPALVGGRGTLEVLTKLGHVLWGTRVSSSKQTRSAAVAEKEQSDIGLQVVDLPPPVKISVLVVDHGTGKPLANARLRHRSGWLGYRVNFTSMDTTDWACEYWRPLGATNARGEAIITVPAKATPWPSNGTCSLKLSVRAKGYAETFAGWSSGKQFVGIKETNHNSKPLRIPLHPQNPLTGRLTLDGKKPAVGVPVLLTKEIVIQSLSGGGTFWNAPQVLTHTDAAGRFVFKNAPRGNGPCRLVALLDAPDLRKQLARDGIPPPLSVSPFSVSVLKGAFGLNEPSRDLGAASLGGERSVLVHFVDPDDNPARGIRASLLPSTKFTSSYGVHNTTDGAGRCLLLPQEDEQVILAVVRGVGFAVHTLRGERELRLTLKPFASMHGRVVWNDGKPAAAASISCAGTRSNGMIPARGDQIGATGIIRRLHYLDARTVSGSDGHFRLDYVPLPKFQLRMRASASHESHYYSAKFEVDSNASPDTTPLKVVIDR